MNDKFWMVYVPAKGKPTFCHESYEEAKDEAARLAGKEGAKVYILESVELVQMKPQPVEHVRL